MSITERQMRFGQHSRKEHHMSILASDTPQAGLKTSKARLRVGSEPSAQQEYDQMVEELLQEETGAFGDSGATAATRESLLPPDDLVELAAGYELPERSDENADDDVHNAAILSIELGRLKRIIETMPPLQRAALRSGLGIGCDRLGVRQLALHVGLSERGADRLLKASERELKRRYAAEAG